MAAQPIVTFDNVTKRFGEFAAVDSLTLEMEQQAIKLVELAHGERK